MKGYNGILELDVFLHHSYALRIKKRQEMSCLAEWMPASYAMLYSVELVRAY
jgi:hypothetical protein